MQGIQRCVAASQMGVQVPSVLCCVVCCAVRLTSRVSLHIKHLEVRVGVAVGAVHAGGTLVHQHRLVAEVALQHTHTHSSSSSSSSSSSRQYDIHRRNASPLRQPQRVHTPRYFTLAHEQRQRKSTAIVLHSPASLGREVAMQ